MCMQSDQLRAHLALVLSVKWRVSAQRNEQHHAQAPHVCLLAVALPAADQKQKHGRAKAGLQQAESRAEAKSRAAPMCRAAAGQKQGCGSLSFQPCAHPLAAQQAADSQGMTAL